ncbi:DedA family protein [Martelella mangrovi]|uniref:Membrane protein DedA with SNARE-associated domain n=1 Tax=Martelella mangrovi TaxID=1397477 RepID=A0ABV2I947_9HYPH
MHLIHESIAMIEPYLRHYGLPALFVIVYLESLGAPLPGESGVICAALLASAGQLPIEGVFLAVAAGAILGDNTGYLIGRYGGRGIIERYGRYIGLNQQRREWIEGLYAQKGAAVVVGARFVVILRQLNGIVAGMMAMRWKPFVVANITGAILWTAVWTSVPFIFGDFFAAHFHDILK